MPDDPQSNDRPTAGSLTDAPLPDVAPGTRSQVRRITHPEWEAIYQAWKAGERNQTALAKRFRVAPDTVHKYIFKGLPVNGWPAFVARQQMEQQISVEARQKASEQIAAQVVDEYGKCRQENLQLLRALRASCSQQVGKMLQSLAGTTWTKHDVKYTAGADGKQLRHSIERPLDAAEVSNIARALSGAVALCGKMESFWLGGPTERLENIPDHEKVTQQDVEWILNNDGQLPPGMTIEQLVSKMNRVYGIGTDGDN